MTTDVLFDAADDGPEPWEMVSDQVMGGVSDGTLAMEEVSGRRALRLTGDVRTENNGGFLQMARDLDRAGEWDGIEVDLRGNGETYNIHLRTTRLHDPRQSFRAALDLGTEWQRMRLPFERFEAHRTDAPFAAAELRRIGLVGIGRAFRMDLALARLAFYAD